MFSSFYVHVKRQWGYHTFWDCSKFSILKWYWRYYTFLIRCVKWKRQSSLAPTLYLVWSRHLLCRGTFGCQAGRLLLFLLLHFLWLFLLLLLLQAGRLLLWRGLVCIISSSFIITRINHLHQFLTPCKVFDSRYGAPLSPVLSTAPAAEYDYNTGTGWVISPFNATYLLPIPSAWIGIPWGAHYLCGQVRGTSGPSGLLWVWVCSNRGTNTGSHHPGPDHLCRDDRCCCTRGRGDEPGWICT